MITDDQKRDIYPKYAQLVCEPKHWLSIARSLYAAAEKLEPEIHRLWKDLHDSIFTPGHVADPRPFEASDYQRVYLMLMAYSLENLFKGFLVGTLKSDLFDQASQDGKLPPMLKTHRLEELAQRCPLHLSPDEHGLLHRLVGHAEWIGRYPYPKRAEEFYTFSDSSPIPGNAIGWSSGEVESIKVLVNNIAEQLGTSLRTHSGGTPSEMRGA